MCKWSSNGSPNLCKKFTDYHTSEKCHRYLSIRSLCSVTSQLPLLSGSIAVVDNAASLVHYASSSYMLYICIFLKRKMRDDQKQGVFLLVRMNCAGSRRRLNAHIQRELTGNFTEADMVETTPIFVPVGRWHMISANHALRHPTSLERSPFYLFFQHAFFIPAIRK